jgi:MOSC domain-containing protein YiiM
VTARLASIQVGRIAPLGPEAVRSAFIKRAIAGPVAVGPLGLDGDAQADLRVHGGPEKAVYGYPAAHYPAWANDFPRLAERFQPGSMGENLTITAWREYDICVGDVHAIGSAFLQVCQPRQPCFKLTLAWGDARLGKAMVRSGRSGWYYRVLRDGAFAAGDEVTLAERPNPDFAFSRLVTIVNLGGATMTEMRAMAEMPGIASRIAAKARAALST